MKVGLCRGFVLVSVVGGNSQLTLESFVHCVWLSCEERERERERERTKHQALGFLARSHL